jgi:hypothetical protein
MHITELGLTAVSFACLEAADLTDVEQLIKHPADELLPQTPHIGPLELYEIICQLNRHGYSLPGTHGGIVRVPDQRHREMLRLRIIDGLTLAEVGLQTGVKKERVRQLLKVYFGVRAIPPAVTARRRRRRQS